MKRTILLSALILLAVLTFGQTKKKDKNFDLGIDAFNSGNYEKAIDYFTLSINKLPATNAIVNRAISFYHTGDTCNFCTDLNWASEMGDSNAHKLYNENCTHTLILEKIPDSIIQKYPYADHLETTTSKCGYERSTSVLCRKSDSIWQVILSPTKVEVFTNVEIMPSFPGGEEARIKFIASNIVYPELAAKYEIEGTVYVSFVIDQEGYAKDVKVLRGIGGGCDTESIRVIRMMPRWNPGTQGGKVVNVLSYMPIDFKLQGPGIPKNHK